MTRSSKIKPSDRNSELLLFAALFGEVEIARALIDLGFDVNKPYKFITWPWPVYGNVVRKMTPLQIAIGARWLPMVKLLLKYGGVLLTFTHTRGSCNRRIATSHVDRTDSMYRRSRDH